MYREMKYTIQPLYNSMLGVNRNGLAISDQCYKGILLIRNIHVGKGI